MDAGELVTASEAWPHSSYETVHEQKNNTDFKCAALLDLGNVIGSSRSNIDVLRTFFFSMVNLWEKMYHMCVT